MVRALSSLLPRIIRSSPPVSLCGFDLRPASARSLSFLKRLDGYTIYNETVHYIKGTSVNSVFRTGKNLRQCDCPRFDERRRCSAFRRGTPLVPGRSVRLETGRNLLDRSHALA